MGNGPFIQCDELGFGERSQRSNFRRLAGRGNAAAPCLAPPSHATTREMSRRKWRPNGIRPLMMKP